jgi:hypothetical protein
MTVMPFGKHKGRRLDEVPRGYLRWMLANCDLSHDLKADIEAVVKGEPLPLSLDQRVQAMMEQKYGR